MKVKLEQAKVRSDVQRAQFGHLRRVLVNPCDTWEKGNTEQKKAVIRACFADKLR